MLAAFSTIGPTELLLILVGASCLLAAVAGAALVLWLVLFGKDRGPRE